MWKRFNKSNDRVASPSRTETAVEAVEAKDAGGPTSLNDGSLSLSSRPAFGRKESQDVVKDLPQIPL